MFPSDGMADDIAAKIHAQEKYNQLSSRAIISKARWPKEAKVKGGLRKGRRAAMAGVPLGGEDLHLSMAGQ